jgi:hypothetical protein
MNDFDLESKLKSVRVPARPDEYWEDFPSRVRVQLRRDCGEFSPQGEWRPRLAWAGGFALAVAMIFLSVQFHAVQSVSLAIAKQERQFHVQLARLDTGLHKLMLNTDGMGNLLSQANLSWIRE